MKTLTSVLWFSIIQETTILYHTVTIHTVAQQQLNSEVFCQQFGHQMHIGDI